MEILIVDDKEENVYLLEALLKGNGYRTVSVRNGKEALQSLQKLKPDLIISDILMPVMDGFTLCRELKKNKNFSKIPFIFYTATYTSLKDEEFAFNLGADKFILKPQDPDVFMKIIEKVLEEVKKKKIQPNMPAKLSEEVVLKEYNSALIRKLEDKMAEAEETEKKLRIINAKLQREIEERKFAEEALKESEMKYRSLVTQSPDGIFIIDRKGNFLSANRTMCKALGFDEQEFLKMNIWDVVPETYKKRFEKRLERIINRKSLNEAFEYQVNGKDGSVHFVEVLSVPYYKDDKLIGFQGIARDITERKLAEEKIALLAHSVKSITECISITDDKDKIIFVNEALLKTYGYSEKELIGKDISVLRPKNSVEQEELKNILTETINGGWKGELINIKKDGSEFPIYLSTSAIRGDNDEFIALIGVANDITEMKQASEEIIYAKELAEKSDRLKTDFLRQMSHEIRTPVSVIVSFIRILKDEFNNLTRNELSEILNSIASSSNRIIRTIELILNMSEMQIGTYHPTWGYIDLVKDVLQNLNYEFSQSAKSKNLELNFKLQLKDAKIRGDQYSINQIFINLLDNAVKYTKKGKIDILVKEENKKIKVSIEDTGIGISDEFMGNIFEPFMQEERGYSRSFEGNGLGLALVKKYCDLNKIKINVESKKEIGSKFTLIFNHA